MKLSDLIKYRNDIAAMPYQQLSVQITEQSALMKQQLLSLAVDIEEDLDILLQNLDGLTASGSQVAYQLKLFNLRLNSYVEQFEKSYFDQSQNIYQMTFNDSDEYVLDKACQYQQQFGQEVCDLIASRIKLYSSWKTPGLHLRPAAGTWVKHMIDLDPLYLADHSEFLLSKTMCQFNPSYQKRLRQVVFDPFNSPKFSTVPRNQIGLIVAIGYFNQMSLDAIQHYLEEFWQLLRPGGVVIFTYNNCDFPECVLKFENKYDCYTPGRLVKQCCEAIGFDVVGEFNTAGVAHWLEVAKPGQISSIRGGQSLAKIMNKPEKT